jgi:hypothetical protein
MFTENLESISGITAMHRNCTRRKRKKMAETKLTDFVNKKSRKKTETFSSGKTFFSTLQCRHHNMYVCVLKQLMVLHLL